LEKASESANHENSILRAQVEKMSVELKEYKKKIASPGSRSSPTLGGTFPSYLSGKGSGSNGINNPNDVNFQFEFPRFGKLPGPPVINGSSISSASTTSPPAAPIHRASTSSNNGSISPFDQTLQHNASFGSIGNNDFFQNNSFAQNTDGVSTDMSAFSGLFTPSVLENADKNFNFDMSTQNNYNSAASRSSTDSSGQHSTGHSTSYSSPSASSNVGSNAGLSSSCGTSPEPSTQSPAAFKSSDNMLSTIGEENATSSAIEGEKTFCQKLSEACGNPQNPIPRTMSKSGITSGNIQTPGFDVNGIDFWAQQNGNQFDPQLFGDYREPQNNILTGGLYDESFFTEAFAIPEFNSPFSVEPSPAAPKKDLVQEIDAKLNEDDEVVPGESRESMLTCNTMWYVLLPE
jgi:AP-1-like factor